MTVSQARSIALVAPISMDIPVDWHLVAKVFFFLVIGAYVMAA